MAEQNTTPGNKEEHIAPPIVGTEARYEDLVAALQHAEAHLETLRRLTGNKATATAAPSHPPVASQPRAAPTLQSTKAPPSTVLLQDIDQEWGATLLENQDLKATLHTLLQQQQILVERQQATDELLARKDVVLRGIQEAVQELKEALSRGPASRNVKSRSASTHKAADSVKADKEQQAAKQREAQAKEEERQRRIALEQSLQTKQAELASLQSTLQQYNTAYQQATEQKQSLEQALAEANALLENHQGMKKQLEHALNAAESEVTSLARVFREMEPLESPAATKQSATPVTPSAPGQQALSISQAPPPPLPIVETVYHENDDFNRNPQDDYYRVSLDPEAAKQGGMAYLQQQMAQVTAYPPRRQRPPSRVPPWSPPSSSSRPVTPMVGRKFPLQPQLDVPSPRSSNNTARPPPR